MIRYSIAILVAAGLCEHYVPMLWAFITSLSLAPILIHAVIGYAIAYFLIYRTIHNRLVKADLARTIATEKKKAEARLI